MLRMREQSEADLLFFLQRPVEEARDASCSFSTKEKYIYSGLLCISLVEPTHVLLGSIFYDFHNHGHSCKVNTFCSI